MSLMEKSNEHLRDSFTRFWCPFLLNWIYIKFAIGPGEAYFSFYMKYLYRRSIFFKIKFENVIKI
jgi:hypothetical protein